MRRAPVLSDDPNRRCEPGLFGGLGDDNGDGTCSYSKHDGQNGVLKCPYGEIPNKAVTECLTSRCSTSYRATRGGASVAVGAGAGYALSRALFPKHPVLGTLGGGLLAGAIFSMWDLSHCLFGETRQ